MGYKKCMLLVCLVFAMIIGLSQAFDYQENDLESEESLWALYEKWRSHHTVSRDLADKQRRFNVFKENIKHVHETNKLDKPYKLKLNKFADMTSHEFRTIFASSKISHHRSLNGLASSKGSFMYANVKDVPASIDWRTKGAVNPVKNQQQCGSCWTFSTIAAVEGINQIKTGKLVSLSEQELVDCDKEQNNGCNGGLMPLAFEWIKKTGGITTEASYPYTAQDGKCNSAKMNAPTVSIDGHEDVPESDEDALTKAVANQVVSVAIDAAGKDFQFYSEGVYTGTCGTDLDHGVAVVGYGTALDKKNKSTKYWIVRNSWGPEWGEKGYIRLERGIAAKEGKCGIAMMASYPVKNSDVNPSGSGGSDDGGDSGDSGDDGGDDWWAAQGKDEL